MRCDRERGTRAGRIPMGGATGPKSDGARMVARRVFLRLVFTVGGGLMTVFPQDLDSIDAAVVDDLRQRTQRLRGSTTETVQPLIPALESHGELLVRVFAVAPPAFRLEVGRMASEVAWLAANAHSDNRDDESDSPCDHACRAG